MKKLIILLLSIILVGCSVSTDGRSDDVVILFTNDIHCAVDGNVSFSNVYAYKEYMQSKSKYVTLVDCGDHVQGSYLGSVSKGEVLVDIMNLVGYDYAILGNHEFDYGMSRLHELIEHANYQYLNCDVTYSGSGTSAVENTKPYAILKCGKKKIALIGVSTPESIYSSSPTNFMEDGKYVYDFCAGNDGQDLYDKVQETVNEVKKAGADYVVCLTHLGTDEENAPYRSVDLINNTYDIDVVLDAHSHSTFTMYSQTNINGDPVICAQTGTGLENLGELIISDGGLISVSLVNDIAKEDEKITEEVNKLVTAYTEKLEEPIAHLDFDLSIKDSNGVRMVRTRETGIGNLVADAFRYIGEADISYVNGGGVRNSLNAGDISYKDIISCQPLSNTVCVIEVTGQEVLDMLEYFSSQTKAEYADITNNAVGENGSFANVSGLRYTINTAVKTSVIMDDKEMLLGVGETRRVSDVYVEENGQFVPIDVNKTYTMALTDYAAKKGGSGMLYFLADHTIAKDAVMMDYEALATYITDYLHGDFSKYATTDNRITIK